jgi:hypothetical protein
MFRLLSRLGPLLFVSLSLLSPAARADGAAPPVAPRPGAPPTVAQEDGDARVLWWLEGRPWSCSDAVGPVARRVELACDASGRRCGVANERARASRVAALSCGPDGGLARLEAEDGEGRSLWSLALAGDDEEAKQRKAAMWIARAEADGPPPAPSDETPLAAPHVPPVAPVPPPAPRVIVIQTKDAAQASTPHAPEESGNLAFDASLVTAMPISAFEPGAGSVVPSVGARFAAAYRVSRSVFLGGAADGMTTPSSAPTTYAHFGGLVAFGAPFTHDWLGASAEGGVSLWIYPDGTSMTLSPTPSAPGQVTTWSRGGSYGVSPRPYGKANLVLQWPRETGIRPYLSASFIVSDDGMNRSAMASLGLAWNER